MSIKRKEFIKLLSAGGAAITLPSFFQNLAQTSEGASRPNIVWLDSEDNCPELGCYSDCSSCYGSSLVHTPNLDRLARQGARYTHAYAPSPVCSPARSAYITGMYPTSIGAGNHRSHRRYDYTLKPPVKPVTEYFMKAGYFCTRGGGGISRTIAPKQIIIFRTSSMMYLMEPTGEIIPPSNPFLHRFILSRPIARLHLGINIDRMSITL